MFPLCLLLGALTTVVIAWSLALWPTPATGLQTALMVARGPRDAELRQLYIVDERRAGVRTYFVIVGSGGPSGSTEQSWHPLVGRTSGTPIWTMRPADRPDILAAISIFPDFVTDGRASVRLPDAPYCPPWPRWLRRIPESPGGLIAHGGRASGWPFATMRSLMRMNAADSSPVWSGSRRILAAGVYQSSPRFAQDPESGSIPLLPDPIAFPASTAMWAALWLALLAGPGLIRRRLRTRRGQCLACAYDLRATPPDHPCPECGALRPSASRLPTP